MLAGYQSTSTRVTLGTASVSTPSSFPTALRDPPGVSGGQLTEPFSFAVSVRFITDRPQRLRRDIPVEMTDVPLKTQGVSRTLPLCLLGDQNIAEWKVFRRRCRNSRAESRFDKSTHVPLDSFR